MKKRNLFLFFTFIIIISCSIVFFQYGSDFFWHLKSGEYIISNHSIPKIDVFSWYASSQQLKWISHEWLFEVFLYFIYHVFSTFGILFLITLILISISTIIWKLNQESFLNHPFYTIGWALCGTIVFANKIIPRPHLFSFLFFSLSLYIAISNYKTPTKKAIYLAPIISFLWSNIHGGSSNLSYLIYGYFLLCSILRYKNIRNLETKNLIYATVTSILAIIINPHGILMLIYPYLNMSYTIMLDCIDEWQSLHLFSIDGCFYTFFILLCLYSIIKNRKSISLSKVILLFIFIILAIKHTRMFPYFFIIASSIIPNYWKKSRIFIDIVPILICMLVMFIVSNSYAFHVMNHSFHLISDDILTYLKNNQTKLYNSYNLGGYLIYQDIPVFIDGRADLYIDTILCDVCQIEKGINPSLLEQYPFDTFLVQKKNSSYNYLYFNGKYKLLIEDKDNALFIKIK